MPNLNGVRFRFLGKRIKPLIALFGTEVGIQKLRFDGWMFECCKMKQAESDESGNIGGKPVIMGLAGICCILLRWCCMLLQSLQLWEEQQSETIGFLQPSVKRSSVTQASLLWLLMETDC